MRGVEPTMKPAPAYRGLSLYSFSQATEKRPIIYTQTNIYSQKSVTLFFFLLQRPNVTMRNNALQRQQQKFLSCFIYPVTTVICQLLYIGSNNWRTALVAYIRGPYYHRSDLYTPTPQVRCRSTFPLCWDELSSISSFRVLTLIVGFTVL